MTTVEWLEQEFIKLESTIGIHGKMYELLEQAKEMEKKQKKEEYLKGYTEGIESGSRYNPD